MNAKTVLFISGLLVIFTLIGIAEFLVSSYNSTSLFGYHTIKIAGISFWESIINNMIYILALIPVMFIAYFSRSLKIDIASLIFIEILVYVATITGAI